MSRKDSESKRKPSGYLEYTEVNKTLHSKEDWRSRAWTDSAQALANYYVANSLQNALVDETAERYGIQANGKTDFLEQEYSNQHSPEYLVDGAILTCSNCTCKEQTIIDDQAEVFQEYLYAPEMDPGIDTASIPGWDSDKFAGRLNVTENPTSDITGLKQATVYDCVKGCNIPYLGNCKKKPDSEMEMAVLRKARQNPSVSGKEKMLEGTCKHPMRLERFWENYGIKSIQTFGDDSGDKPGITMTSILFCQHGGFINPVTSGQVVSGSNVINGRLENEKKNR